MPHCESFLKFKIFSTALPSAYQPDSDWTRIDHLDRLDPEEKYIERVKIQISRSIQKYPLVPSMNQAQFISLDKEMKNDLRNISSYNGIYYSLPREIAIIHKLHTVEKREIHSQCGNYGKILSHFFDKNFMKVTFY